MDENNRLNKTWAKEHEQIQFTSSSPYRLHFIIDRVKLSSTQVRIDRHNNRSSYNVVSYTSGSVFNNNAIIERHVLFYHCHIGSMATMASLMLSSKSRIARKLKILFNEN
ncbi:hypothetical protein BLOT_004957 [Blomia tropicalis]|nr:hypothetical protein BLOT_004957 [Blomia tropicalis]